MRVGFPSITVHNRKDAGDPEMTIAVAHIVTIGRTAVWAGDKAADGPTRATIITVARQIIETTESYEEVQKMVSRS